ncbi:hypothetical protein NPS46_24890 [Pseudomonas putida]|uniref:hypothetical protein n=1 Tax=Pseudomonas putida TaxID=303 RepID=UPI002363B1B6|nr:hypothetical protein [Pseudomonas putida]MDD2055795.1 hypothetical protein [Pseudomonas putida]
MTYPITQADLQFAHNARQALVEHLQAGPLHDDTLAIAGVGDLEVRIAAAEALLAWAERSPAAQIEARLAAAHAAQRAGELLLEFTGQTLLRPTVEGQVLPLAHLRRRLGDHYLNAAVLG